MKVRRLLAVAALCTAASAPSFGADANAGLTWDGANLIYRISYSKP